MPLKAIFRTGGSFPVLQLIRLTLEQINTSMPMKISILIQFDTYNTMKLIIMKPAPVLKIENGVIYELHRIAHIRLFICKY